jgi:predicted metal-binding protein
MKTRAPVLRKQWKLHTRKAREKGDWLLGDGSQLSESLLQKLSTLAKYRQLQTATVECSTECSGHLALVIDNEQLC